MCGRYATDEDDAVTMLNDGFLKIFKKINQYNNQGSFEGWMKRILVNTCIDHVRVKKRRLNMEENMDFDKANFVRNSYVVQDYSAIERLNVLDLHKMIQNLPEVSKLVFNLYVFEGYSHKEISKILNLKVGTSHWHLSRARTLLQAKIAIENKPAYSAYERK